MRLAIGGWVENRLPKFMPNSGWMMNTAFATFTAQGDLNANGIPSTFQRSAAGQNGGGVTGGSGVYVTSDVE